MGGVMVGAEGAAGAGMHPTRRVVANMTRATSSASNVTSIATMPIGVQGVRRRRETKLSMLEWKTSRRH
jgi:hypothetical protein